VYCCIVIRGQSHDVDVGRVPCVVVFHLTNVECKRPAPRHYSRYVTGCQRPIHKAQNNCVHKASRPRCIEGWREPKHAPTYAAQLAGRALACLPCKAATQALDQSPDSLGHCDEEGHYNNTTRPAGQAGEQLCSQLQANKIGPCIGNCRRPRETTCKREIRF